MNRSKPIETIAELRSHYVAPVPASVAKVVHELTPLYTDWIRASRFCFLSTVGPNGTDCSPRGDDGSVAYPLDKYHVAIPDWRGNNRLDSLENIILDGRVSLSFMIGGSNTVVRLNGSAIVTRDQNLREKFAKGDVLPIVIIVIKIGEIYTQCARAFLRSKLWDQVAPENLPTVGQLLAEASEQKMGGPNYDRQWLERAQKTLWND